MRNFLVVLMISSCSLAAQVHTVTLHEAIELALKQSPDVTLARLNERRALDAIRVAKSPFIPSITAGSGLAYSNGFPMSIEGATPSILQTQASGLVFNRPQSYLVSQARENSRAASLDTEAKREQVALRAALLFLDAERAGKLAAAAHRQIESMERILAAVRLRAEEGRELPVKVKEAELNLARARQQAVSLDFEKDYHEHSLALVLGFSAEERAEPAAEDRHPLPLTLSEEQAVRLALTSSKELKRLESELVAKGFAIRSIRAERLPQVDLVAQYALLGRFNNYEDFFRKFQRNNGQLGISFRIPLFPQPGIESRVSQAETEAAQLRVQLRNAKSTLALETHRLYHLVREAESAAEVAKLDLEVARERLSVLLAQLEEGRASLQQVEEARFVEDQKWMAFLDAHYSLEKARLNLLGQTGELLAALP